MKMSMVADVPPKYLPGLIAGYYKMPAMLITKAAGTPGGGQIELWARALTDLPLPTNQLISKGINFNMLSNILGFASPVASVLNLGATICFGVEMINRLSQIENKLVVIKAQLNRIEKKIDKIKWTIDWGFLTTRVLIEKLFKYHEVELISHIQTAATLANEAQSLEPNSNNRQLKIENANTEIEFALNNLLYHLDGEMDVQIETFKKSTISKNRLYIQEQAINVMKRFRTTCIATSLKASISAESGDIENSVKVLTQNHSKLSDYLKSLGHYFLRGANQDSACYADLLNKKWKGVISPSRLELWSKRFDAELGSLNNILEFLRDTKNTTKISEGYDTKINKLDISNYTKDQLIRLYRKSEPAADKSSYSALNSYTKRQIFNWIKKASPVDAPTRKIPENTKTFFDLLDGAYEDLDRIEGYIAEYKTAVSMGLSIQDYRDMLRIDDAPQDENLVFLAPATNEEKNN